MKLLALHVEGFGVLQSYDLAFSDGLNVLYQKNGWGKSTLAVFIKAMLYGLPATSRRSLDENERKKYLPWNGGAYGGSLDFETALGKFRVERFFAAKESGDSFALFDLLTNKPSTVYSLRLGEELFGIDADGFERSTYLSQRILDDGKDNSSIGARLGNLLDDVDDIAGFDTAMEALDKRRRHYVMTGNRGAIAELEQARVEKQAELERCVRVKEAMQAQEARLADCNTEIQAIQKTLDENRSRLQKAGLAREQAALLEHKNNMLEELSSLNAQKKRCDDFFRGTPPSDGEIAEHRALYEQLRDCGIRLETINSPSPDAKALAQLKDCYRQGLPNEAALDRAEQKNQDLLDLAARRNTLEASCASDPLSRRFPAGAPTQAQLDKASHSLQHVKNLQKAMLEFENSSKAKLGFSIALPIGIVLAAAGIACMLFSFFSESKLFFLAGGGVCLAAAALLCILSAVQRTKEQKKRNVMRKKQEEWKQRCDRELQTVWSLLNAYQIPCSEADPSRGLTELTLLTAQYRESEQKRRHMEEDLKRIMREQTDRSLDLQRFFTKYLPDVQPKRDYRTELETLRRDVHQFLRLQAAVHRRTLEISAVQSEMEHLKAALLPFLHRFDPNQKWRAGDCLDQVAQHYTERERLLRLIAEKDSALRSFIAEKHLEDTAEITDPEEYDRLIQNERQLQANVTDLQKQHTVLKNEIERLSIDADRIPDLYEEIAQMKEQLEEARANAVTIANTAKLLEEAKTALSTRYLEGMQSNFREFFTALTGEDAPESMMDTSFAVRLRESGQTRTIESFSRGVRDAVRFCTRLSLAKALCAKGEKQFLLLDDPFVNLDDQRLADARALLDKLAADYQILYFVCHKDRV